MEAIDREAPLETFLRRIADDHRAGRLPLPPLPMVAVKVRQAVEDERLGVADVARVIQLDPALTAQVIQAANSAHFGGLAPVANVLGAVSRLGMRGVRDRVMALTLKGVFAHPSPATARRLQSLWQHSVRVAAISHVLGSIGPDLDPERALLAGLVHDIGALPLLAYAEEYPVLARDELLLDRVMERLRARMGALVLRAWGFEDELVRVALEAEHWTRDPAPMPDYADVVVLANIFSDFGSSATRPNLATLPAFQKFPLGALGPEGGVEVLEEAQDQIRVVMSMLQ
jgi:HD-like signal output (HDOD) protein